MSVIAVHVRNLIGGEWSPGSSNDVIDVVNPASGEVVTEFHSSSELDVDRAVAAARAAAPAWAALTTGERARYLNRIADVVAARLDELRDIEILDTGKPVTPADNDEFPLIIDSLRFFINSARALTSQSAAEYVPGVTTFYTREPLGVVAAITPWNYPLWLAVWKVVPALATGNTVILKPAENTPMSSTRFTEIAASILPPGVLNLVHGHGYTVGDRLARHLDVDLVTFTGSVETGRAIARGAAERPRRSILELGGNAPVVVLADADLNDAAATIATMSTYNAGQECMAATRLLVHDSVVDELTGLLVDELRSVVMGDPFDPATTLGPVISAAQLERIDHLVEGRPDRAKVLTGGRRADRPGFYYEPTVITGLEQDDELVQQEIFGPVVTVQTFSTTSEAIRKANGVPFGLSASVWTESVDVGLRVMSALDFGQVWLNTHLAVGLDFPLGGFNESGYGKEGGIAGIEEFTRVKQLGVRTRPLPEDPDA